MQLKVEHPTIEEVFKDFYEVPAFQREYVWKTEQVEALLSDAHEALFDENGSPTQSEYFIGSIVSYKADDIFQLIDGQQRITTLFIILCAIRDKRNQLQDPESINFLESMIFAQYQTTEGTTRERLRLKPLYEDASDILQCLASSSDIKSRNEKLPASAKNMLEAYHAAIEFLDEKFGDDVVSLRKFQASFTRRVRLVRIQTGSVSEALRIFETINDRGIGLNALDLLKNLLFMQTKADEFDRLTQIWKEMVHTIEKIKKGEKPLRFLRYFVLSQYPDARKNGKPLTEDDLYEWLSEHKDMLGISSNPIEYARKLLNAAKSYKLHIAQPNKHLAHIYQLSSRARQHLIMMLATDNMNDDEQLEVARYLESLFVGFVLAKEPTKALDLSFANAAPALVTFIKENIESPQRIEKLREFLDAWSQPELNKLKPRITVALEQLSLTRKTACRFILSRTAQHIDEICTGHIKNIGDYWRNHIEHVLPNQPTESQRESFDKKSDYDVYKQKLGNLTLLESSINCSIGNDFFQDKQEQYLKSSIFMTRSLSKSQSLGETAAYTKAAKLLPTYSEWSSQTIDQRHQDLISIANNIWGFN